ncbi:acyltransferase [Bacteroides hominis]|uniref:acyltransferase n=1 Tax=Bacteroides hominis TaxID=2763023 RepID=UPI001D0E8CCC|nr:acyltransferase [Bacteroides hominis (ex Afrizal et al. 2022)]MCC2235778.1 acyltransferase [Bacteroides hominis (ex Afrizal et al. 2022)]MCY6328371.1 acyltransferase [Bacteroides fragilis]
MIQNSISDNRIVWLDVIRCVAMIMVIGVHCIDPFYISPTMRAIPEYTYWAAIYGSLLRPSVPLFVMMTGLLLLPVKKQPLDKFYKKRIYRVLFPFLIWSVLYSMFPWFTGVLGLPKEIIGDFFCYTQGQESQSLIDSLKDVAMIPFNFSHKENHMWYIYLLIGLYLYMPFFSAWIENADRKTKRAFLLIWIISLFIPYLKEYVANCLFERSGYVFGTDTWNEFGLFYYFAGFNGYLLLGHYVKKGNDWSLMKTFILCILMFAVGYYITYTGFSTTASNPNATETEMELFFTFCSPNVLLMTLATFLLLQKVVITNSTVIKVLANMTQCGFGIYMVHYFVVGPFFLLIGPSSLPIPLQVPLMAICIFLCSWAFTALIYKLMPRKAVWFMG